MSVKDRVVRIVTTESEEEAEAFVHFISTANEATAREVISQIKSLLKDESIQPTEKLAALQLFHMCMETGNGPFLHYAQKKILRRLGEFARHRMFSTFPDRGADIFGDCQGEQQTASIKFLRTLLNAIKSWAAHYGIAPHGGESDYLILYRTLEAEKVAFPTDHRMAAHFPWGHPSNAHRFKIELSKCRETADLLTQELVESSPSELASTASHANAYLVQLEMVIQARSSQDSSEAELNLLLDCYDYLSKAVDAYEAQKNKRSLDPKQTLLATTLSQTQASIDQAEKELSEIRHRIYTLRTSEGHSNPDQVPKEQEAREEAHRTRFSELSQSDGNLEQQVAETMQQIEQLQTVLKQKTAEMERDSKVYAQVTEENRELASRLEEASRRAYIKVADSPPDSPEPQEPPFFASDAF